MLNKKYFLMSSLILVFLLVSSATCEKDTQVTGDWGWIGGTEGLLASFVPDQPPASVLSGGNEPFYITVQLENQGEYDVKPDEILSTVYGFDYKAFDIQEESKYLSEPLVGQKEEAGTIISGDISQLDYEANFLDILPYQQPFDVSVNYCYRYQTRAGIKLCLKQTPRERTTETECAVSNNELDFGASGAPVQISAPSQRPTGKNEVSVTFTVSNANAGSIYSSDFIKTGTCMDDRDYADKVYVAVNFASGDIPINCPKLSNGNSGEVKLIEGKTTITCSIDTTNEQATAFEKPLSIAIDYAYKDSITQPITIEKSYDEGA